jgi:hypothetical protein
MYKVIILIFAICFTLATLSTADVTPKNVQSAFQKKFPSAKNVTWRNENANEFEAEFTLNGKKVTVNFSDDGTWIGTETEISVEKLPAAVQTSFEKMHGKQKNLRAAIIENASATIIFELEFKNGEKNEEVFFSENGKMIEQKKKLNEEDEEEEEVEEEEDEEEEGND